MPVTRSLLAASALISAAAASYAPTSVTCPTSTTLVREATGLSSAESAYIEDRDVKASAALEAWLEGTGAGFDTSDLPRLALASSGGGWRASLVGAGVVQALDSRDSDTSVSGLYQALSYHSALSGGGWLLGSMAAYNWATISTITADEWYTTFEYGLELPGGADVVVAEAEIDVDIAEKLAAGFTTSIVDEWGRLIGWQFLPGSDGGVDILMSDLATYSNFTAHNVPFPVIVATWIDLSNDTCYPLESNPIFELTPLEFGSWDNGVSAFVNMTYLGSSFTDGEATSCVVGFDNLGFELGTTSDIWPELCSTLDASLFEVDYGVYPNPFYGYSTSSEVSGFEDLTLADGGIGNQNVPLWPLIQPARAIDVMLVSDNSADTDYNWPNGSEIRTTYEQAQAQGLTLMPYVPDADTFVSEGLNKRPIFFGCNETEAITLVYLPNSEYTYPSNTSTSQLIYSQAESEEMIGNGNEIATYGGSDTWGTCLGCAIMLKTNTTLPSACTACFDEFCYGGYAS